LLNKQTFKNTKQNKMTHTQTQLTINGLQHNICYYEAKGLSLCFAAYSEFAIGECIMEGGIGFNPNSGYVYIALENGISICSMLGREVEYLVTDFNDGEEHFFDTYEEAETFEPNED
jgi:hypothetical protein